MSRNAQPHTREYLADCLTPLGVYRRLLEASPVGFLFESVSGGEQVSRYSFLGSDPRVILRLYTDRVERQTEDQVEVLDGDTLEALRTELSRISSSQPDVPAAGIPFTGGYVGYFGYDLIRLVENLPHRPPDPFDLPVAILARFDNLVVFDHAQQRVVAVANEIEGEVDRAAAEAALNELNTLLTAPGTGGAVAMTADPVKAGTTLSANVGDCGYEAGVKRIKEHIEAGDIFQAVLARRFDMPRRIPPLALYRALRKINPSPYMVLLELPECALVGASPEMMVRKTGRRLEVRPIAGTRPRGADAEADRRLAEDLLADPKECAEHIMLVDLARNDLGRVARPGSVTVPNFMQVEYYSHVMHIVSEVEAELETGRDGLDALLACFPAGTVSGAPKVRAMQIIDEQEPEARGPYAGAVGYFSFSGDVDTCITIRTLLVEEDRVSVTAGAGLVADSNPASEARETENKAAALLAAVDLAESLEGSS